MLQVPQLPLGHILPKGAPEVIAVGKLRDTLIRRFTILFEESCNQSFGYEQILYTRLESLVLYIYRLYEDYLPRDCIMDINESNIAVAAKNFIDLYFHNGIRLGDISTAVSASDSYLIHAFAAYYHISPIQYLIGRRLNESMKMLRTSKLSVKEIAARTGFDNLSNFNNHFRRHIGVCPTQFRENGINNAENPNQWTIYIH
jgi:AraC-like DNA-binding protein